MCNFKRCSRCIMDNLSDKNISFDKDGVCNYCKAAYEAKPYVYFPNAEGKKKLADMIEFLKREGQDKE